jgi:putative resolvase
MEQIYSPKEFGRLIGRSVKTLQRWDRLGILKAHRSPTNRRYYTHAQYLAYRGITSTQERDRDAALHQDSPPGERG